MEYGQHFFCIHIKPQDLFNIAGVMSINLPQVYYSNINIPNANISLIINNLTISSANSYAYSFNTIGGLPFTYFAKAGKANVDLYESIISPYYNDGMLLQTWGRPYEQNFCPSGGYQYANENINEIQIGKYWWYGYYDHSKWGIGINTQMVCYSDINRMYSQWVRGGGAVCTLNTGLYNYMSKIIENAGPC